MHALRNVDVQLQRRTLRGKVLLRGRVFVGWRGAVPGVF